MRRNNDENIQIRFLVAFSACARSKKAHVQRLEVCHQDISKIS